MPGRFNYAQNLVPPCSFDYGIYRYDSGVRKEELNNPIDVLYSARGNGVNGSSGLGGFDMRAAPGSTEFTPAYSAATPRLDQQHGENDPLVSLVKQLADPNSGAIMNDPNLRDAISKNPAIN